MAVWRFNTSPKLTVNLIGHVALADAFAAHQDRVVRIIRPPANNEFPLLHVVGVKERTKGRQHVLLAQALTDAVPSDCVKGIGAVVHDSVDDIVVGEKKKRVSHQRDIKVPTGSSPLILINGADAERRRIINENAKKGGFYYIWGYFVFVCVCWCVWVCKNKKDVFPKIKIKRYIIT